MKPATIALSILWAIVFVWIGWNVWRIFFSDDYGMPDSEDCAFWHLCPDCGAEAIFETIETFGPGILLQCPNEDSDTCHHNIVYGIDKEDAEKQWVELCES